MSYLLQADQKYEQSSKTNNYPPRQKGSHFGTKHFRAKNTLFMPSWYPGLTSSKILTFLADSFFGLTRASFSSKETRSTFKDWHASQMQQNAQKTTQVRDGKLLWEKNNIGRLVLSWGKSSVLNCEALVMLWSHKKWHKNQQQIILQYKAKAKWVTARKHTIHMCYAVI